MSSSVMFLWRPANSATVFTSASAPAVLMQKKARGEIRKSSPKYLIKKNRKFKFGFDT